MKRWQHSQLYEGLEYQLWLFLMYLKMKYSPFIAVCNSASFHIFCCFFYYCVKLFLKWQELKWWDINGTSSIFVAFFFFFTALAFLSQLLGQIVFWHSWTIASTECVCDDKAFENTPVLWQSSGDHVLCDRPPVCVCTCGVELGCQCHTTVSMFVFSLFDQEYSESQSVFLWWHIVEMPQTLCVHVFLQVLVKYYRRSSTVKKENFQSPKRPFDRCEAIRIYILLLTFHGCRIRRKIVLYSQTHYKMMKY